MGFQCERHDVSGARLALLPMKAKCSAWVGVRTGMMSYDEGGIRIGDRKGFARERSAFWLSQQDRMRHIYAVGKTGQGKTEFLRSMIQQDIEAGRGVMVIDPHGDLAEECIAMVPKWRYDETIILDPSDVERPLGFNVLDRQPGEDISRIADSVIGALRGIWSDSWGPRMEYVLRFTLLALLEAGNTTLLGVDRFLTNERYRRKILWKVRDPVVREKWRVEFARTDPRRWSEWTMPILDKTGAFAASRPLRNIIGQVKSSFTLRDLMDDSGIMIVNLAKGGMGESESNLLGALLLGRIYFTALGRRDAPRAERTPFFVFVDEFHSFNSDRIGDALSSARKFGLSLTLAHQYLGQLEERSGRTLKAVLGTVGTHCAFGIGPQDAAELEQFFTPWKAEELSDLGVGEILIRPTVAGRQVAPFIIETSISDRYRRGQALRGLCRQTRGRPRARVEARLASWYEKHEPLLGGRQHDRQTRGRSR